MVALDLIKLALYSRLLRASDRPHWYRNFLKSRHAARAVAETARANA
jgi:hypothetical protein